MRMTFLDALELAAVGRWDEAWELAKLDEGLLPEVTKEQWIEVAKRSLAERAQKSSEMPTTSIILNLKLGDTTMSNYEAKQAAKKAYYAEKAKKLEAEAERLYQYDRQQMELIPAGQPILVGHHSERRHRAMLKRSHQRMNKICELDQKARHYQQKAETKNYAISSDDENAITKLKNKLANLEAKQEEMKRINAEYRKGGFDAITGITEEAKAFLKAEMQRCHWYDKPYPSFYLSNNNVEIRRIKQRIAELEKMQAAPAREPIKGNGYTVTENKEDNRIWFEFDEKPKPEVCSIMHQYGFRWSRSRVAWVRMINGNAWYSIECIINAITPLLDKDSI